ncbi:DUF4293 domain-containing protein [Cardinium endosymbiont of Nabis limbatus]|uniref:DUF4293 domain-containing protein n=1 Tax=Cardinium endosymbiont of Nabis limbatus TaxID=3066217 RepID=UPI003AF38ADF
MIQRMQSLYLGAVCITMAAFLKASIWVKIDVGHVYTIKPYALIAATGQSITFPYSISALLASCLVLTAAYAIMRHDNRRLQLRLIARMNLIFVILMALILVLIKKVHATYLLSGHSSYQIGAILPFIALVASLLARHHIKKDEKLVNEDRLR